MELKILGYDYTISVIDSTQYNGSNCGFCDSAKQHIRLSDDLSQDMRNSTLLHEILEALNYHLELKLEHPQITSLEAGLYQTLKDNNLERFNELFGGTNESEDRA